MNTQRIWSALWWPFRIYRKSALTLARCLERSAGFPTPLAVQCPGYFQPLLKRNVANAGKHQGRRCIIYGNGPSLGQLDLSAFRDDITFGVNAFYKHSQAQACQPSYYCLSPDCYFDESETSQAFLKGLLDTIDKSVFYVPLFPGLGPEEKIVEDGLLPLVRTFFIPHIGSLVSDEIKRVDFLHPVPGGVNIVQEALLTAFHLGCNPIYLVGMEHDWLATRSEYTHFYNDLARHPTFRYIEKWSYCERIQGALQTWQCYYTLNRYAQQHGIRIVNLTPNSYLDVFEMGNLADVLGTGKA